MTLQEIEADIKPKFAQVIDRITPSDFEMKLELLGPIEWNTLIQKVGGQSNKKIAKEEGVCLRTVEARAARIRKVLGVPTILEAVALVATYLATRPKPTVVRGSERGILYGDGMY